MHRRNPSAESIKDAEIFWLRQALAFRERENAALRQQLAQANHRLAWGDHALWSVGQDNARLREIIDLLGVRIDRQRRELHQTIHALQVEVLRLHPIVPPPVVRQTDGPLGSSPIRPR